MQATDASHYLPHSITSQSQPSFRANMAQDAPSLTTKPSHATFATTVYSKEFDTESIIPSLPTIIKSDQYQETSIEKGTSSEDIDPPPDGGLQAWMTVLGCSLVSFSTFGFVIIPPSNNVASLIHLITPQNRKCIRCFQWLLQCPLPFRLFSRSRKHGRLNRSICFIRLYVVSCFFFFFTSLMIHTSST